MQNEPIPWWTVQLGQREIDRVVQSIENKLISQGENTERLEAEIAAALGVPYAVATTSGSTALFMALMAVGVGPGDEVIVPGRSFIATAHAVLLTGAAVVLSDIQTEIPLLDVAKIEEKVTAKTKAVIPVHLNGRSVDMEGLKKTIAGRRISVIEDAAQSLFSENRAGYLGTQSDVGCFSLGMTKLLPTGQGGIAVTKQETIYEKLKLIRNHGVRDTFSASYNQPGFNFKYTDIQAAIGLEQLKRVPDKIRNLKATYLRYSKGLSSCTIVDLIPVKLEDGELPLYIEALSRKRDRLIGYLNAKNIQVRPFHPDLYASQHIHNNPESIKPTIFHKYGLFLPGGPDLKSEHIDVVIHEIKEFEKGIGE